MYARNSEAEEEPTVNAGYRALNSLQMSNNEHIVKSLFSQPIFSLGISPTVDTETEVDITDPKYNLRYNRTIDSDTQRPIVDAETSYLPVDTLNKDTAEQHYNAPVPKVDGIMTQAGEPLDT